MDFLYNNDVDNSDYLNCKFKIQKVGCHLWRITLLMGGQELGSRTVDGKTLAIMLKYPSFYLCPRLFYIGSDSFNYVF